MYKSPIELTFEPMETIAEEISTAIDGQIKEAVVTATRNVHIEVNEGELIRALNYDRDLLKRAITNLIQNSINHNESGCEIYVSVSADNDNCIIRVEDNGVGATDEQIEQLNHAPHYMVCDTNTTGQRHGLGLLIVKQILDGHNGKTIIGHSSYGGFKAELVIPKQ